jgi:lipoprotein NlpI
LLQTLSADAYFGRGDVEKAVADYTTAIRLAPKEADVQSLRGWAYFVRGAMDKAIGDSTAATRLDPNSAFAFRNRGRAYLYSGRPRPAADDFAAAVKAAPGDVLGVVWLHVARVRAGQPDQQETLMNLTKVDRSKWPGPIADVLSGTITQDKLLEIAQADAGKSQRPNGCAMPASIWASYSSQQKIRRKLANCFRPRSKTARLVWPRRPSTRSQGSN